MKQDKYREALQNRTIKPSLDSWETLNGKLSALDKKPKRRYWVFLKVAAVVLIFISVGSYFWQESDTAISPPVIASPTLEEKLNSLPKVDDANNSEIVVSPETSPIKNDPVIDQIINKVTPLEVATAEPANEDISTKEVHDLAVIDSVSEVILLTETLDLKDQNIDDEVEQLLNNSKIKLVVNGQISSKKVVDAQTLLNSVEEDLYKDLKQKLIEKITNSLKNPKEVVTSREK